MLIYPTDIPKLHTFVGKKQTNPTNKNSTRLQSSAKRLSPSPPPFLVLASLETSFFLLFPSPPPTVSGIPNEKKPNRPRENAFHAKLLVEVAPLWVVKHAWWRWGCKKQLSIQPAGKAKNTGYKASKKEKGSWFLVWIPESLSNIIIP